MIINGNDIFMGARTERNWQSCMRQQGWDQANESKKAEAAQKAATDLEMKGHNVVQGGNVKVSISQTAYDRLFTEEGHEQIKSEAEDFWIQNAQQQKEIAKGRESEDIFWTSTGNQWMVFSKHLYDSGFYDGMTDEDIEETEEILARITGGMDGVSRWQYHTGVCFSDYSYGNIMRQDEAAMELVSSTAALNRFADTFLSGEKKEEFSRLIDMYHAHNMEVLKDYEHPFEGVQRGIAAVQSGMYPDSNIFEEKIGMQVTEEHKFTMILTKVRHSQTEKDQFLKDVAGIFDLLQKGTESADAIWSRLKEIYADYATDHNEDEPLRNYVLDQAKGTFDRMRDYWSRLSAAHITVH